MSGKGGEAAFVDIRSIGGLSGAVNRQLSQQICQLLNDSLGLAPDRVYLNFTEVEADRLGVERKHFRVITMDLPRRRSSSPQPSPPAGGEGEGLNSSHCSHVLCSVF